MQLNEQTVIITGGASGLGEATARRFQANGAQVAILDVNDEAGASLAAELDVHYEHCNVADAESVEHAVGAVHAAFGPARIAVCCAGVADGSRMIGRRGPHRLDTFEKVMAINVTGTFHVLREVAWRLRELEPVGPDGERGVLITTASIAAFDGVDGGVAYSASKGAVAAMTLPLARDLAVAVGTCGHLSDLRRVSVGPFEESASISLEKLEELGHSAAASPILLPIETALDGIPALALSDREAEMLRNGQAVPVLRPQDRERIATAGDDGIVLALEATTPVALVRVDGIQIRPVRVLNLDTGS